MPAFVLILLFWGLGACVGQAGELSRQELERLTGVAPASAERLSDARMDELRGRFLDCS